MTIILQTPAQAGGYAQEVSTAWGTNLSTFFHQVMGSTASPSTYSITVNGLPAGPNKDLGNNAVVVIDPLCSTGV